MDKSAERMLIRLPEVYAKGEDSNVRKVLSIPSEQMDELYNALDTINTWRDVSNAKGKALDIIGESIGQYRGKAIDDVYRILIKSKILRGASKGTGSDIIRILATAFNISPQQVTLSSRWSTEPGSVFINIPSDVLAGTGLTMSQFGTLCQSIVAAGVRAVPLAVGTFSFSSVMNVSQTSNQAGFNTLSAGNVPGTTGGYFGATYDPAEEKELPI